jgi:site-specific DNA-methyltransferase (adenine-specific)
MRIERIGDAVLYLGDCMEILPTLGKVDAVITDPPYGISLKSGSGTGGKWDYVRHAGKTIANDDKPFDPLPLLQLAVPMIAWGANFYSDKLPGAGWLVWDKRPGIEDMQFNRSDSELAYFSESKTVKTFRHLWHGLCRASEVGQHLHPTQKPVALMRWCLEQLPNAVTILDPYMGAGSTGVAAIEAGRKFIGIELEPTYFDIACRRIEQAYKQRPLFEAEPVKPPQQLGLESA